MQEGLRTIAEQLIRNKKIELEISHQFLNDTELLDFLASNSINSFMYEDTGGRGLSSTVDNALAVNRPIAVSNSPMFRHILRNCPFANAQEFSLREIMNNSTGCLNKLSKDWSRENLQWEYERILNTIFRNTKESSPGRKGILKSVRSIWRKLFTLPDETFTWLTNTEIASEDNLSRISDFVYTPVNLEGNSFNRILDDRARILYNPAIQVLHKLVPLTMAKKIERANVQQAFVFDTVYRFSKEYDHPKLLCVGSYEDTASMSLQKAGFDVEEIDPMINYFLQDYFEKAFDKKKLFRYHLFNVSH